MQWYLILFNENGQQNFVTQWMGQSSMFLTFHTVYNIKILVGRIWTLGCERRVRKNTRATHLCIEMQLVSENLGERDSSVSNIPGPFPYLNEACFKKISASKGAHKPLTMRGVYIL